MAGFAVMLPMMRSVALVRRLHFVGNGHPWQHIEGTLAAYTEAFERVLGVPPGSLTLADGQTMQEWLVSAEEQAEGRPARGQPSMSC